MKKINPDIFNWIGGGFLALLALFYVKENLITSLAFFALSLFILPITKNLFFSLDKSVKLIVGFLLLMIAFGTMPKSEKTEILKEGSTQIGLVTPTETITPTSTQGLILVTKIIDGDTLMVKIDDKEEAVRLIGIDTPETVSSRETVQCFGKEASGRAVELMENKLVKLEADESQENKDIYNRLLRYVYLEDGTLVNKKLIEDGFGFEYTYKIPYKFQAEFKEAQKLAEQKKVGLWADGVCPTPTVKIIPTSTKVPVTNIKEIQIIEPIIAPVKIVQPISSSNFVCDCSKICTQISTCEEAYFQLNDCGCSIRDGDEDGVPCESLCN